MPHNPRGRNERGQDERNSRQESPSRRQTANARNGREDGQWGKRAERNYRSTIPSSIDYDRNAE